MVKHITKYYRLSLDDGINSESNSIDSQRCIIENYIATVSDFAGMPKMEFSEACDILDPTQKSLYLQGFKGWSFF
jgi:hypothetical protein